MMTAAGEERHEVISRLGSAVELLEGAMDIRLIPASGSNIGFAVRHARDGRDVAAVRGGIVVQEGRFPRSWPCAFDTGTDISRVVLTAMKFDPDLRSAAVIAYSTEARSLLADMSTECCEVDRTKAPPSISTMDWGIASCCSAGVPDVICDRGTKQSAGLIWLFGQDAPGVASTIIILSRRIQ
jgi:predicted fused transcriptional regulator/phosphomethylpyrimidine kinase